MLTDCHPGLQTPRLKRLAEIVSAQAMVQQEKAEYLDGPNGDLDIANGDLDGM